jgi:hypothetical protein
MRQVPALGLAAAAALALASCTGGGGTATPSPTTDSPTTTTAADKVYSEEELRELVSGMSDADGNELKLYSSEQVDQGEQIARFLLNTATVDPEDCKAIATAGLLDSVEEGEVAVSISESENPRTLSAQSGQEGPRAAELLEDLRGNMDQCSAFTVEAAGQRINVTSEELQADTNGEETFATLSTRGEGTSDMLMQVSAAQGRLLVVATRSGADLGDPERTELEDLVNEVLDKAENGASPTTTRTPTTTPTGTETETEGTETSGTGTTPSPTRTATDDATVTPTPVPTTTP